jgi:hypothetical protein
MPSLFDPHLGQWWNELPADQFVAYYLTLRVHYAMSAREAFAKARANGPLVGVGYPGGICGLIRDNLRR